MWEALHEIAVEHRCSIHDIVTEIACDLGTSSLTSAIRVYVVIYYRDKFADYAAAEHGERRVKS